MTTPAVPPRHEPVMLSRIVDLLTPALSAPGAVYVDCTLGLAGHARAVLAAAPRATLIGIDRDAQALALARSALRSDGFGDRVTLVQAVYDELPDVLEDLGVGGVQAVLADLGLSSLQIDDRERGFAYSVDSPLDMRMTPGVGISAADVVNTYSVGELTRILRVFGEERFADRISRAIVRARESEPFGTSRRLVDVISSAIPAAARASGGHPAKRTFQALRIEVNAELEALSGFLPAALGAIAPGGRIAILAYHSLEDRLVKRALREASTDNAPRHMPVVPPEHQARFRLLTRGAERPDEAEVASNPRSASARLRAAERREVTR